MAENLTGFKILSNPSPERRSLSQRAIAAGIWSVGGFGINLVLRFGSNLLLTRLLAPDLFGVMAIATVVM
jgi:O-antigen/teichoic acid export membrane protein